jgi:hypothetical protein
MAVEANHQSLHLLALSHIFKEGQWNALRQIICFPSQFQLPDLHHSISPLECEVEGAAASKVLGEKTAEVAASSGVATVVVAIFGSFQVVRHLVIVMISLAS